MEATVLSWRFQNILSIIVIIIGLSVVAALFGQGFHLMNNQGS